MADPYESRILPRELTEVRRGSAYPSNPANADWIISGSLIFVSSDTGETRKYPSLVNVYPPPPSSSNGKLQLGHTKRLSNLKSQTQQERWCRYRCMNPHLTLLAKACSFPYIRPASVSSKNCVRCVKRRAKLQARRYRNCLRHFVMTYSSKGGEISLSQISQSGRIPIIPKIAG